MLADIQAAIDRGSRLCVGLDPSPNQLQKWGLSVDVSGLRAFVETSLKAVEGVATIVKPQVAYFEEHGPAGLAVLSELIRELQSGGVFVIADAKRGDIGSTMAGYMRGWLTEEGFNASALTVHSYLGMDILPETAAGIGLSPKRGFFALCATSNPEGSVIQQSKTDERTLARFLFDEAESISANQEYTVGVVIGATLVLEDLGLDDLRTRKSEIPILAPGYGVQGAQLSNLNQYFGASSEMVLPSLSRELLGADATGFRDRILNAMDEIK